MEILKRMNAWLEISACTGDPPAVEIASDALQNRAALAEALRVAESTSAKRNNAAIWDYARRLEPDELSNLHELLKFRKAREDARSIVYQSVISYKNSLYTLNLFVEKGQ